ncbi:MAG: acylase [Spirulinaceae cyanobacterium RM2_2_10]|nr:acylase [Spirulinaceae cyanobacterium SM2_1_0]NJO20600.1 acylase [Spirulinaceae cyanobacterium RM2_2_10]
MMHRRWYWKLALPALLAGVIAFLFSFYTTAMASDRAEILWDRWGVPHIFSETDAGVFEAFGYAQMHSHGDLLLRLYGQARGRGAEYWGEEYLSADRYTRTLDIPERGKTWYAAQSPVMRANLDAFAAGINRYAATHPADITAAVQVVLPVTAADVLAHIQRVIHGHFLTNPRAVATQAGSNAWALAPSHSRSGRALLLTNPHLPWQDFFLLYEAHLNGPGWNNYGVALVGMPMLAIAFNDQLGWTATVNPHNGTTLYALDVTEAGYRWQGEIEPFETEVQTVKVKQADGRLREESLIVRRSRHGPIIGERDGQPLALRIAGFDRPQIAQQLWEMGRAGDRQEFEAALSRLQLPLFNILYADRSGDILYVFNALVPERGEGNWADWQQPQPGDRPDRLWQRYHPYRDLPRLLNPTSGWLQNTNDPPWTCTLPSPLAATDYPAYLAPPDLTGAANLFRTQRSLQLLQAQASFSLDDLIAAKFDTQLALGDRLADDLIAAARAKTASPLAQQAADVLAAWDRRADADSRGAALFGLWRLRLGRNLRFAQPWQANQPLTTPAGLGDPETAVAALEQAATELGLGYGAVDVPWGEVVRLRYGEIDLPANGASGALGSFQVIDATPAADGKFASAAGDTYIAALEFGEAVTARVLNTYGNASQPGSPHVGDQLALYARGELRPAWRSRTEIEANLEQREVL